MTRMHMATRMSMTPSLHAPRTPIHTWPHAYAHVAARLCTRGCMAMHTWPYAYLHAHVQYFDSAEDLARKLVTDDLLAISASMRRHSAEMVSCTHAHMHTCTHARTHARSHACMHSMHPCTPCTHAPMHPRMHTCTHVCTHAPIRMHLCTHASIFLHLPLTSL